MRARVRVAVLVFGLCGVSADVAAQCGMLHIIQVKIDGDSGKNGVDAPTEKVCAGDTIVWSIENATAERVKLKLKDFRKKGTTEGKPPKFVGSDQVTIEAGYFGALLATLPTSLGGGAPFTIKYVTELKRSGEPDKELDPELEMQQPPPLVPPRGRGGRGGVPRPGAQRD